ncbi:MAG: hypothetical protein GTO30_22430 [Acidobacteria bacterium]|nr:hypothetical protein [Acidobacteriota bacterium]NIM64308.1 hypothetical protein [Acidobacteriota bacterium]NIQ84951.1 hypothetical protein [Acidobacteriota bacterium]NIT10765.1 hypothetical protein [Acidobacteriota bacterium]
MYRSWTRAAVAVLLLAVAAGSVDAARYRYGRSYSGGEQAGIVITVEGGLVNLRNADLVYATSESRQLVGGGLNQVTPLTPGAEDDLSGRLGVSYQFANGNRLSVSFWSYSTSTSAAADGPLSGQLHYAVGPPIALGAGMFAGASGSPGHFSLMTDTDAASADFAFGRSHELGDDFRMEWSTGVRYARFEESTSGFYDDSVFVAATFGENRYAVAKTIEGDMIGARVAARGSYFFTPSFSVSAAIGFGLLDGEITASSGLTPTGSVNALAQPSSLATIKDDGRSGYTIDYDTRVTWHTMDDRLRVWLGWEQQQWSGIARDDLRDFPGTAAPQNVRDSVVFSGYRIGVSYRF